MTKLFENKNIAYWFIADFSFFSSFWMCFINMSWLIFLHTKSSFYLGLLSFMVNIPFLLIMPFSGVMADLYDKRKILITVQFLLLLPIASLIFFKLNTLELLWVGFSYGAMMAIARPAGLVFINELVENKQNLLRLITLFQTNARSSQFIAAAGSSIIQAVYSVVMAFAFAFFSTIVALLSLLMIKPTKESEKKAGPRKKPLEILHQGFSHVIKFKPFWATILLSVIANTMVSSYMSQLPSFASHNLDGGLKTLSHFYIFAGLGAILSGIALQFRKQRKNIMVLACFAEFVIGIGLIIFSQSYSHIISFAMVFLIAGSFIIVLSSCNATIQLIADKQIRGVIIGIFGMAVMGLTPFTYLLVGTLSHYFTPQHVIVGNGCIAIAAALWYFAQLKGLRLQLIPIYQKLNLSRIEQPL